MTVDLRDLELLAATAEFGTLSAAAERLHVTQPALSQRLARLEDRLGTPLFDRVGRRLVPTAAGRRMLVAAHHVLRELGSARQDLRELREARERRVRFAAQHGSPCHWLPPVIRAFRGRHPDAEVRIETLPDDAPVPALLADRVDVALVGDPDTGDGRISLTRLFADELVAVVPGSHPWAALPHLRAEDFGTAHLLLPDLYDRSRIPPVPLPLPRAARPARITT
ncbi:LysR family transcriptional regulator, partial [Streptomyces clavuligerus]